MSSTSPAITPEALPPIGAAVPSWPRYLLLCVALTVCGISQWYIFQQLEWRYATWGLGLGALIAAWALGAPSPLAAAAALRAEPSTPLNRGSGVFFGTLGFAAAVTGTSLLAFAWYQFFALGWALIVGGVGVWSYGLSRLDQPLRKAVAPVTWSRVEVLLFVGIVALGLFLRLYRYDYFPPPEGVCAVEEPQSGQGANMILAGARPWEFMLDRWLPVIGFLTMGHSITAIRIPFTIVSWLTIIPLYLLTRELMSRPAALFATFLFAVCRWHLIYARHAHAVFGPTLPIILTDLYLCVRAYKYGGLAVYPWIGVLSGYTLYTYAGYRATTVFIGLFFAISLAHHLLTLRRATAVEVVSATRRSFKVQLVGMLLVVIGFMLLAVPLVSQLSWNPFFFFEAAVRATEDPGYYTSDSRLYWLVRSERLRIAAMMFNHFGDGSPTFNLPGTPQLDPVSGFLFVIGLAYCVVWARYRFQGFFGFYFLFLFFMGTIFVHNYDVRRLQGLIPLIFIMVGYAVDRFGQVTLARFGNRARGLVVGLFLLAGGAALHDNYRIYFQEMMSTPAVRASFHNTYTVAVSYLHKLPDNAYMLLISDMGNFFTPSDFEWVRGKRVPGRTSTDLLPLFLGENGPWIGRDLHLLIQEPFYESDELVPLIKARFPAAECGKYVHSDQPVYADFGFCRVPTKAKPDGVGFRGGIRARYYRGDAAEPFLERIDPVISFAFTPHACRLPAADGKPPCRVVWEGTWDVPEAGEYVLVADTRKARLTATIDGQVLVMPSPDNPETDKTAQINVNLAAGPHQVRVEAKYVGIEVIGTRLRYQVRSGGWQLVPFASLP